MKSLFIISFFVLLVNPGEAQHPRLSRWVQERKFPELEKALAGKNISQQEKDLYHVFLLNAYGDAAGSNQLLATVQKSGIVKKGDSLDYYLHLVEYDNLVKLYDYKSAWEKNAQLTKTFAAFYTEKDQEDLKQADLIWKFLSPEKAQTLTKKGDTRLSLKRDMAGLWRLPVTMGDTTVDFVFDTGAGMSTLTRTYAKKMGVRLIDSAFVEIKSGITGIGNQVQLGMAPQLVVGNMVVKNVVFLVFPDEAFTFPQANYAIEGILGLPVIKEFESFTIENETIFIPEKPVRHHKAKHNMMMDLLKPVVYMHYRGVDLPFTFDSGATSSNFSDVFYRVYKKEVDAKAQKKTSSFGGAGGVVSKEVLVMPKLKFKVQNKSVVFKEAEVSTEEIQTNGQIYYGNVGQDLINQFKKMTISFKWSYIWFE